MKLENVFKKVDSYSKLGLVGLRISLFFLIFILGAMIIFISFNSNFSEIIPFLLKMPEGSDYIAIFGLSILFIAVPFLTAIKIKKKL